MTNKFSRNIIIFGLFCILLLGAAVRFYKIREYMVFLGDEGRDALVVKQIIVDHKFTLLGPTTSVGSMYMGPIYYYFMVPFLWAFNLDPVGPSYMVAIFSVATIALLFYTVNRYYSARAALLASFFYAISPLTIFYGRSSWNPNLVPFFSLLIIFAVCKVVIEKSNLYLLLVGAALGICVQLHYISLVLVPIIFVCLALVRFRIPIVYYLLGIFGFLNTFSPFLAFELRHNFTNSRAVLAFLEKGNENKSVLGLGSFIYYVSDVLVRLFWRLSIVENAELTKIAIALIFLTFVMTAWKIKTHTPFLKVIAVWFVVGLFFYGLYKGTIYDYYMVPLFSLPFIFVGITLDSVWRFKQWGKFAVLITIVLLGIFNFRKSPVLSAPNNLIQITENISKFVFNKVDHQPYNFALIANKNSDHAYRYFLEVWGAPPVPIENPAIDPQRKTVQDVLFVVCEEKECKPLGHPLWEIAGFGKARIDREWKVENVTVFKLTHFSEK